METSESRISTRKIMVKYPDIKVWDTSTILTLSSARAVVTWAIIPVRSAPVTVMMAIINNILARYDSQALTGSTPFAIRWLNLLRLEVVLMFVKYVATVGISPRRG